MGRATEQREAPPAGAPGPCEPALQRPVTAALSRVSAHRRHRYLWSHSGGIGEECRQGGVSGQRGSGPTTWES